MSSEEKKVFDPQPQQESDLDSNTWLRYGEFSLHAKP